MEIDQELLLVDPIHAIFVTILGIKVIYKYDQGTRAFRSFVSVEMKSDRDILVIKDMNKNRNLFSYYNEQYYHFPLARYHFPQAFITNHRQAITNYVVCTLYGVSNKSPYLIEVKPNSALAI